MKRLLRRFADHKDEITAALAVSADITERKAAEARLLEKNRLLEQTHDAIFIWRLDDGIVYWNKNAEEALRLLTRKKFSERKFMKF